MGTYVSIYDYPTRRAVEIGFPKAHIVRAESGWIIYDQAPNDKGLSTRTRRALLIGYLLIMTICAGYEFWKILNW